jgi:surface polysaccharide O-acyltransferase-like enzyme
MRMANKLFEFENMRGIAILAVVIIHVTAGATISYTSGSISYFSYNIVNSFLQFAVPLFLFISSVVLSWKLSQEEKTPLSLFYRKRMRGVVFPYLLWSFLYIVLKLVLYRDSSMLSWSFLGKELLNGTAFYHLYFLLIIMQLYLLLPFFKILLQKMKFIYVFVLTVILQAGFYYLNKIWIYQLYPHPANLLGSYLSVFIIGSWLGLNYQRVKTVLWPYKRYFWMLHLALAALFITINIRLRMGAPVGLTIFYGSYHFFVLAASVSIWLYSLQKQRTFWQSFGKHSFAIYLIHPFFLAVWQYLWQAAGYVTSSHFFYLFGFLFTISLSYVASLILTKWSLLRRIFLAR